MLQIYDTLTRKKHEFNPLRIGKASLYQCGPTVYWIQHIGNLRAVVMTDLVVRTLNFVGYGVNFVRNYTDVGHLTSDSDTGEDKMEKGAKREGMSPKQIAEKYIAIFEKDCHLLHTQKPTILCRATEYISEIIQLTQKLLDSKHAYSTDLAVYFDTETFPAYDTLSRQNREALVVGAGKGTVEDSNKKNPADFALWFFKAGTHAHVLQYWPSPFRSRLVENGEGFPGWHIECSAMSMKNLGETLDIHMGGVEHIPVHHTNEIAQSEAATGKTFVRYWMHYEHLLVNGEKMSKSLGNVYSIDDLQQKGYHPLALRYFFLQAHYRSRQNFTFEALQASTSALNSILSTVMLLAQTNVKQGTIIEVQQKKFIQAIEDDVNIPKALAILWEVINSDEAGSDKLATILSFDEVLGLRLRDILKYKVPQKIFDMADSRSNFRKESKFDEADAARLKIEREGYKVEDTEFGSFVVAQNPLDLLTP
ncbi:MAG: cysteine--tRNA ligase [Candidatus Roizmanbacteria bacterium]|nr:cysteine--tRNA ligase [Candidatus Roizmanbacteria bacterium]